MTTKRKPREPSEQKAIVERMWAEGKSGREIAEAVGWSTSNPSTYINVYRKRGYKLPHRHSRARVERGRAKRWPTCSVCGQRVKVKGDGNLYRHGRPSCSGSGKAAA